MSGYARAAELVEEIRALLGEDVTVTADPRKILPALSAMRPVVAVNPPDMDFPTWTATDLEWEIHVIAGPFADRNTAWKTMDDIITALVEPLAVTSAKTAAFAVANNPEYPAYVLTFSETL